MLEVELKSVVDDLDLRRRSVEAAGGVLRFAGRLHDRRYDTTEGALRARDHVLRVRVWRGDGTARATLDWKGPTAERDGYKVRDECVVGIDDAAELGAVLAQLGYDVAQAIDRDVWEYDVSGATVRFEQYPRMDALVEVEGTPAAIERAVSATGLPRAGFTAERLTEFVRRYEARTGAAAVLADAAQNGTRGYSGADA